MAVRDILDWQGNVLGTLEFPDGTPEATWDAALSAYNQPPALGMAALDLKGAAYIAFGKNLFSYLQEKVWAINAAAVAQGDGPTQQQLLTILAASVNIRAALEGGNLTSAKALIATLVASFPIFTALAADVDAQIDSFIGANP